jgi:hypothetical protein
LRYPIYVVALALALFLPVIVAIGFTSYGPQPYVLVAPVGGEWAAPREYPDGSRVTVGDAGTHQRARAAAADLLDTVPIADSGQLFSITRYRTDTTGIYGLVMPIDRYVVHVEAPDEATREARFEAIPFIAENPEPNLFWIALTRHANWVAPGIFAYCLVWCFAMARGGAWAMRLEPEDPARAASAEELKRTLLALDRMNQPFKVDQIGENRLRVDWRVDDLAWITAMNQTGMRRANRLELDLDPATRTVRAVEKSHRIKWGQGFVPFSGRFAFFRAVAMAGRDYGKPAGVAFDRSRGWKRDDAFVHRFQVAEMKSPVVDAVLGSGWTWQPVISFVRPLAG